MTRAWAGGLIAVWLIIALATVLAMAIASYTGGITAPSFDEWGFTNPADYLPALFHKYNGHPFVVGRLGLALDYYAFDARGWALRATTFLLIGLAVGGVVVIGRAAGLRSLLSQVLLGAFAATVLFIGQGAQNFIWGFQFAFVLAFASTIAAIAALAAYATEAKRWKLALAIGCSVIASASLANGLLAPLILLLMAWRLRLSKRIVAGLALLTALIWIGFALMPSRAAAQPAFSVAVLPDMIAYALRVLGSAPAAVLRDVGGPALDPMLTSLIFGAVGVVAGLVLIFFAAVKSQNRNPGRIGGAALAVFALSSAGLIGLARGALWPQLALAPRYLIVSEILFLGICVLVAAALVGAQRTLNNAILTIGALICVSIPVTSVLALPAMADAQRVRALGQTRMVAGEIVPVNFQSPASVLAATNGLRTRAKWLFQDRWSRAIGQVVDVSAARTCEGAQGLRDRQRIAHGFVGFNGLVNADETRLGRIVVITDAQHRMFGYGLVTRDPRDLFLPFGHQDRQSRWVGYGRVTPEQLGSRYTAYLASPELILCRIGQPVTIPGRTGRAQ